MTQYGFEPRASHISIPDMPQTITATTQNVMVTFPWMATRRNGSKT